MTTYIGYIDELRLAVHPVCQSCNLTRYHGTAMFPAHIRKPHRKTHGVIAYDLPISIAIMQLNKKHNQEFSDRGRQGDAK